MTGKTFLLYLIIGVAICTAIFILYKITQHRGQRIPKNLQRSNNYRAVYFQDNKGIGGKGIYFCPYCGKMMRNPKKVQIDHIYSIRRVQKSPQLSERFKKLPNGVNDISNLTHSCSACNQRKGAKGGVWVFLGHYGQYFMPAIRWVAYTAIVVTVGYAVLFSGWRI